MIKELGAQLPVFGPAGYHAPYCPVQFLGSIISGSRDLGISATWFAIVPVPLLA